MINDQPLIAYEHLLSSYPKLSELIKKVGVITIPETEHKTMDEAVVSIIIGQMLSRTAADTIYSRVLRIKSDRKLFSPLELLDSELLGCGLSQRKVKSIRSYQTFKFMHGGETDRLDFNELEEIMVGKVWGFGAWSLSMLGFFYFRSPNIFPQGDATLQKVINRLNQTLLIDGKLNECKASPYKSYLALYLWYFNDNGLI